MPQANEVVSIVDKKFWIEYNLLCVKNFRLDTGSTVCPHALSINFW